MQVTVTLTEKDEIEIVKKSLLSAISCFEQCIKNAGSDDTSPMYSRNPAVEEEICRKDIEALGRVLGMY